MPVVDSTSDNQLIGDNQDQILESHSLCPHVDEFYDAERDGFKNVHHRCKYVDMYDRCIRDHCIYDPKESPKTAHKQWIKCILCNQSHSIDPRQMSVPICDKCLALLAESLTLPFTCMKCGKKQKHYSKAIFSRLCDKCWSTYMFNDVCRRWQQGKKKTPSGHDCLP